MMDSPGFEPGALPMPRARSAADLRARFLLETLVLLNSLGTHFHPVVEVYLLSHHNAGRRIP